MMSARQEPPSPQAILGGVNPSYTLLSVKQIDNYFLGLMPAKPTSPEPNNQAAAGTGILAITIKRPN